MRLRRAKTHPPNPTAKRGLTGRGSDTTAAVVGCGWSAGSAPPQRVEGVEDLGRVGSAKLDDRLLLGGLLPSVPETVAHGPQLGRHRRIGRRKRAPKRGARE